MSKISTIEIHFPVAVELPDGWEQALGSLIDMVCNKYENENPKRVMWVGGQGSRPKFNWMVVDDEHPQEFDNEVYSIQVVEREASERELERKARGRKFH